MRILTIAALCAAAFMSSASAEDKIVYGAGAVTWGAWLQDRSSGNKAALYQLQAWIDGYLSGSNASGDGPDFIAPKPTDVAYYAWIDNYCAKNPLNLLMVAVFKLEKELQSRATSR
jgi:hypothetical protein